MARIFYGISGEGAGHSSRAKEIITHLEAQGHTVKAISYDKGYKILNPLFDVTRVAGLQFSYEDNKVRFRKTVWKNVLNSPEMLKSIEKVKKLFNDFKPNIVFSDFEPISCIVANLKNVPLISIDNQHRFTNTKLEYPSKYEADALAAKAVINAMIFNSKACLVTTFSKTKVTNHKTFLFPPILRKEVLNLESKCGDHILVYLTSKFDQLPEVLKGVDQKFIIYGFDKECQDDNLTYKKRSLDGFLNDLASCKGVIANAGFTLITEALSLQKPYLAIPVAGQFEQVYNAYLLEKLGYGKYEEKIDQQKVGSFLKDLKIYQKNLKTYRKNDNSRILKAIDVLVKKHCRGRDK